MWRSLIALSAALAVAGSAVAAAARVDDDGTAILLAAGDIAQCTIGSSQTADVVRAALGDAAPGQAVVATLGDNAYQSGTLDEFLRCYDPSWGQFRAITHPSAGNHEYGTPGGAGYFSYFGDAAAPQHGGYYSYDLGSWHIVVLNSNCEFVGGCGVGSAQLTWLKDDLAAHRTRCTLAYWHYPLFTSGQRFLPIPATTDFWNVLYAGGADVVLNGHDHHYERFAPQTPEGQLDPNGIREFVVGTGGATLVPQRDQVIPNSQAVNGASWGVLELRLHPFSYEWKFLPIVGATYSDSGNGACHFESKPVVVGGRPSLLGSARVGRALSVSLPTLAGRQPISVRISWERCNRRSRCSLVPFVHAAAYRISRRDLGWKFTAIITATNSLGSSVMKTRSFEVRAS
jgi:hypothetical protein